MKKYGSNSILEPLVHDLNVLEFTGIEVPLFDEPVYGTIKQVTGVNLGFANHFSRSEKIHQPDLTWNGIGLHAIQTFCLIYCMPLIFGDAVKEGNAHWRLLLLLLQIINTFSPVITDGMTVCLMHLIVEHHELFKELYPHRKIMKVIIPEPLKNRPNSPCLDNLKPSMGFSRTLSKMSLAQNYQMAMAYHWESMLFKSIDCGSAKTVQLADLPSFAEHLQALGKNLKKTVKKCQLESTFAPLNVQCWLFK